MKLINDKIWSSMEKETEFLRALPTQVFAFMKQGYALEWMIEGRTNEE